MPLIILGLLLLLCLLAYSIVRYLNSGEEDTRTVRERYPHAFPPKEKKEDADHADAAEASGDTDDEDEVIYAEGYVDSDSFRGDLEYMFRNIKDDVKKRAKERGIDLDQFGRGTGNSDSDEDKKKDGKTIIFPTDNVEQEKNKRNIH